MKKVHQQMTAQFVDSLKQGVKPFECPWDQQISWGIPVNAYTGRPYRGSNVLNLWMAQLKYGFASHQWMTYRQAKLYVFNRARENGVELIKHKRLQGDGYFFTEPGGDSIGGVRQGARGVKCLTYQVKADGDREEGKPAQSTRRHIVRWFSVFNLDQIDGVAHLNTVYDAEPEPAYDAVRALLGRAAADVRFRVEGVQAYYSPHENLIVVPDKARFESLDDFYAVCLHELVHATGATTRLNRERGVGQKDPKYAFEELVAEIGSAFLMAQFGLKGKLIDHPNYVAGWLTQLESDSTALQRAAALADKAVQFINEQYCSSEQAA